MGYITVTTDVDIDYDDLDEDDLIDALEYKLERYERRDQKSNKEKLTAAIKDLVNDNSKSEDLAFTDLPGSMLEHTTIVVLKQLSKKYTLTQLEELLNK